MVLLSLLILLVFLLLLEFDSCGHLDLSSDDKVELPEDSAKFFYVFTEKKNSICVWNKWHNSFISPCLCFSLSVIDVLSLEDVKQTVAAVEKVSLALKTLSDVYVLSTFRLPPKLGGVLLGLYNKQDNKKYLEVAIMSKINKGIMQLWPFVLIIIS